MNNINILESQNISIDVLNEKYIKGDEKSIDDIYRRVAKGIASVEKTKAKRELWEEFFYKNMQAGAIGAGRIMSSAGTGIKATLMNCFVMGVGDCIQGYDNDGYAGIYEALRQAAETMRRGGGVGYDFSRIRPRNAFVKGTHSMASGPCSYMDVFDSSCRTVESAGARRGAQMGVLKISHPDIMEFVTAKRTPGRWNNFNVSVFVTDAFMKAKNKDLDWELVHVAEPSKALKNSGAYKREDGLWVYSKIKALDLWNTIMKSNYDFAEPGILFEDNINNDNNLRYVERLNATNPCVTGDTVILTMDGYKRIDSVVDTEVQIWNGFQWSYVTPHITGENQEIFDMEFSDGTKLSSTPYHKFILEDGTRVEAKDLFIGQKLSKFNFPVIQGQNTIDEKVAYTQGFYSGDGQADTNRIWLYNGKTELVPFLSLSAYSDQSNDNQNRLMASMDFHPQAKNFVPGVEFDINTRTNWLAGLIDSDGSVSDGVVAIWSVDRNFLNNVKLMLNTLGVTGTLAIGKHSGEKLMPNDKGGQSIYSCQDCWRLTISSTSVEFLKYLGLNTHRVDISHLASRDSSRFIQLTFKQKRSFLEPKVYCFTDELNNSGVFNGIMTANCGEQPLPSYGCCDLGPIDLTKFVKKPFNEKASFDFESFKLSVAIQARFLDNVLEATIWPLKEQKAESDSKRRIGIGFTGLGNALAMLNLVYASDEGLAMATKIAIVMRDTAYLSSVDIAKEKGAFPLFNVDKYLEDGTFASRLPPHIKSEIRKHGIRNSHCLSIAPTGTVSLAFCDNASNGIEPPFSLAYTRKKRNGDGAHSFYQVIDHGLRVYLSTIDQEEAKAILDAVCEYKKEYEFNGEIKSLKESLPKSLVVALEMTAKEHLDMLRVVQPYIDSAISKTVNVPGDYPFDSFKAIYDDAHSYKLKGVSTYRPNNILGSVLSVGTEVKKEVLPNIDPLNIELTKRPEMDLEAISKKVKYMTSLGDNTFYVCVSFAEVKGILNNKEITVKRPIEVFITAYPDGVPGEWVAAFARNMSLLARSGLSMFCRALADSRKVKSDKGSIRYGIYVKPDGTKVPRWHDSDVACISYSVQEILQKKGIIDEAGNVLSLEDIVENSGISTIKEEIVKTMDINTNIVNGKACGECGAHAVIKKDGCSFCTNCGHLGSCG